jgi:hypothetical protein
MVFDNLVNGQTMDACRHRAAACSPCEDQLLTCKQTLWPHVLDAPAGRPSRFWLTLSSLFKSQSAL